jgi:hypothetical protein
MYVFFSFRLKVVQNAVISKNQFFAKKQYGYENPEFYADFKFVDASFKKYSYKETFFRNIFFEILSTNLKSE